MINPQISKDEHEHIQAEHQRIKIDPAVKAVLLIDTAIEKVLSELGVDLNRDIPEQKELFGIHILESKDFIPDNVAPHLSGFYIMKEKNDTIVPVALVGDAFVNQNSQISVQITWFEKMKIEYITGERIETK